MKIYVKQIMPTPIQEILGAYKVVVTNRKCNVCHNKFYFRNNGTEYNNGQVDNNCCQDCQFWVDNFIADRHGDNAVVIDREHRRMTTSEGNYMNFSGRKFVIRFADGRIVNTGLSHQGTIPEWFTESFPENAEFVPEKALVA